MDNLSQQIRRSGRSGAGTHPSRKRANSQLVDHARSVVTPTSSTTKRRRQVSNVRSSPPAESLQQEEEGEDEEDVDGSIDDEAVEDTEDLSWCGSRKATINKKIDLSRCQLGIWTANNLLKEVLTIWRFDSLWAYNGSLKLTYSWLEAIVTHEKACAKVDTALMDLRDGDLLEELYRTLYKDIEQGKRPCLILICYFDGVEPPSQALPLSTQVSTQATLRTPRQTTISRQLSTLPEVLEQEAVIGNTGPVIAQIWVCRCSQCKNKGGICWVKGVRDRDNLKDHFPISGLVPSIYTNYSKIKEKVT